MKNNILKSQLKPKMANHFLNKLNETDVAEIVRDNKTSIGFYVSEDFAGFLFKPFPVYC